MVTFVSQSVQFRRGRATMATISGTILAIAYIGLLGGFIIQMRWLEGTYPRPDPAGDARRRGQGGRHRGLHPRPDRRAEQALAGGQPEQDDRGGPRAAWSSASAFVLVITAVARYLLHARTLSWTAAVGFGVVVSIAAQLGDLMESMIKRDCAQKDASDTLPGFGGVLDVLDSLLFAGPVAYGYWVCFGP